MINTGDEIICINDDWYDVETMERSNDPSDPKKGDEVVVRAKDRNGFLFLSGGGNPLTSYHPNHFKRKQDTVVKGIMFNTVTRKRTKINQHPIKT